MMGPQDDVQVLMSIGPDGSQVDVTDRVQSIRIRRGRDRETDNYQPGTCQLSLLDNDRRFDPHHVARLGWVDFQDVSGSTDSTPDAAALDITGDIAVVARLHNLQSSAAFRELVSKFDRTGDQRSWWLRIASSDKLIWSWSTDGTAATVASVNSADISHLFGLADVWVAVSHDVDTGGGNTVLFWTSTDGESWDLLSAVADESATTSIFASTAGLHVSAIDGGTVNPMHDGGVVQVRVYDGIGGSLGLPDGGTLVAERSYLYDEDQTSPYTDLLGNVWTLNGSDWSFDDNGGTPYAGNLTPLREVEVHYTAAASTELFVGFVEDWGTDYREGDTDAIVDVPCIDLMGVFANMELDELAAPAHAGEASGDRIERVLALPEVDQSGVAGVFIDVGLSTLGATTFGSNALDYLQRCSTAEAGYLFVTRGGTLLFNDRHHTLTVDPGLVFVDEHTYTGSEVKYKRVEQTSTGDLLHNRVTGQSETTGTQQSAEDSASQSEFFVRALGLGELFNEDDAEVLDLLTYTLQRFRAPEPRFRQIEVNTSGRTTSHVELLANLELAVVVDVKRTPFGVGDPIEQTCLVDGVEHDITPGSWTTRIRLSNADTRPFLILNDATYGRLGENRLAF